MTKRPNSRVNLDRAIERLFGPYESSTETRSVLANAVVGQMLQGAVVKGGSGLKFRYGLARTRATMDLDAACRGDIAQFEREFEQDLLVIDEAVKTCGLPDNLKLSIHSGSDKFSIYPVMGRLIRKYDKGIHIKTAGTTWLEENIGLAVADPDALKLAKKIYVNALGRMDELTVPYATVIDVDVKALPSPEEVEKWDAETYARTMRHNQADPLYNPSFRQLIHVSYKIAAELGDEFYPALEKHTGVIGREITENLCGRHIRRLFG